MGGVITEEKVISRAQYLDLIYSQMGTLYVLIPDSPSPSTNSTPTPPVASLATDGMIVTFHVETQSKEVSHTNPKSTISNVQNAPNPTPSLGKTFEVGFVQYTPTDKKQNVKKRKGMNKEDKNNNKESEKTKTQPANDKDKRKPHFPCLIYGEDHYTKYFP
jgi:hypothetical protein